MARAHFSSFFLPNKSCCHLFTKQRWKLVYIFHFKLFWSYRWTFLIRENDLHLNIYNYFLFNSEPHCRSIVNITNTAFGLRLLCKNRGVIFDSIFSIQSLSFSLISMNEITERHWNWHCYFFLNSMEFSPIWCYGCPICFVSFRLLCFVVCMQFSCNDHVFLYKNSASLSISNFCL